MRCALAAVLTALAVGGSTEQPLTTDEVTALRALLGGTGTLPRLRLAGPLRIDNPVPEPAIFVHQQGGSTATVVRQDSPNPVMKLTHQLSKACLELVAADPDAAHDQVDMYAGDLRARQLIAAFINVGRDPRSGALGAIHFLDPEDTRPSPDYHWGICMDRDQTIHVGNPERPQSVRVRTGEGTIDFEAGGVLQMRVSARGVWVRRLTERP